MNRKMLKYIKNDMWEVLYNKKYLQATLKTKIKELETERKEAIKENGNDEFSWYWNERTNENFDHRKAKLIESEFNQWHNDQSYYLIYKDGSETCISAEEILGGEKFPKMSDIVYAELQSADEHVDTEKGDLDWYSEEAMEACDYDYEIEYERKWQYETAIQFKFGTDWSRRYHMNHPEFVPAEV